MPACPNCSTENSEFNIHCHACNSPLHSSVFFEDPTRPMRRQVPSAANSNEGDLQLPAHLTDVQEIGRGGMGVVYKARDTRLMRHLALKCLTFPVGRERDEARILKEARAISKVNHHNLVTIYEVYPLQERMAIAMEWVDGQTLGEHLPSPRSNQIYDYMLGLANGLKAAHEKGIVHGDIKASNVMIDRQGTVKLLDFGLAHHHRQPTESPRPLQGTPTAMAPEQLVHQGASKASDVFSLGLLFYEMVTGTKAFAKDTLEETLKAIGEESPKEPRKVNPRLSKDLDRLIMACLHKDPRQRPDMNTIAGELKTLQTRRLQNKPRALYLGGGLALAIVLLALAYWQKPLPPDVAPLHSVALLPLKNLTGDSSLDVLIAGTFTELTSHLQAQARENGNWVLPAAQIYGKDPPTPRYLADNFGIDTVISGSIHYHQDHYRITLTRLNLQNPRASVEQILDLTDVQLIGQPLALLESIQDLLVWPHENTELDYLAGGDVFWRQYLQAQGYLYRHDRPGNLQRAIDGFEAVLAARPQFINAHLALAQAYRLDWALNEHVEAITSATLQIERALQIRNDLSLVHATHGDILVAQGAYEKALNAFTKAKEYDPQNPAAFYGLGRVHTQLRNPAKAEAAYNEATRLAPFDWVGQTEFGRFFFISGQFEKAVPIFQNLVRLAPENAFAQGNLGVSLYYSGNPRLGLQAVNRAIEIKPNAFLYSTQGTIAFYLKDYQAAAQSFTKAVELKDTKYMYQGNLGDALRLAGDHAASRQAYERAIERVDAELAVNPEQHEMRLDLILYLAKTNQADRARDEMTRLPRNGGPLFTYLQALAYAILGETDKAFPLLEQALDGGYPFFEVQAEPEWDALREDPRYIALSESFQKSG
ncbi:Non-specific serine/threonine protein kinase [Sulfidibacter corallicola]